MLAIRRILLLIVMVVSVAVSDAQTMRQVWMDMPDAMVPYLNRSNRTELADYVDMHVEAAIRNRLEDTTRIEALTADYAMVRLNASMRLEMRLLPRPDGGKVLCVVRTWLGPAADSRVSFYDMDWNPATDIQPVNVDYSRLLSRPEGMSAERYDELCAMLVPMFVEYRLSEAEEELTANLSMSLVSSDDMADLRSILHTVTLRWDGSCFDDDGM